MATGHWLNVHCLVNIWIGKCSAVCTILRQKCKSGLMNTAALSCFCTFVNMLELLSCLGFVSVSSFYACVVPHLLKKNSSTHQFTLNWIHSSASPPLSSCVEPAVFSPPLFGCVFLAAHKHLQLGLLDVLVIISHGTKRCPKENKKQNDAVNDVVKAWLTRWMYMSARWR